MAGTRFLFSRPGVKKSTYVYQAIYNQLKMMLREQGAAKRAFEKQAKSAEEQYNLRARDENMEDRILEDLILRSRSNALHWAIRNGGLTEDEQKTVYMLLQDMLQKEIGEELGCTQSHVSILKKRALKKSGRLFRMRSGMARVSGIRSLCNKLERGAVWKHCLSSFLSIKIALLKAA